MKALRFFLWLILFLCLYAGMLVLFQYPPSDFGKGFKEQWSTAQKVTGLKQ